ncbi:hypothetical protein B0H14DRAFT_3084655 [Mycena olivaceomarginata]|nr:hypothetical protein B0H14DRAFT_3084655 [Mycena olivaceomarginata]
MSVRMSRRTDYKRTGRSGLRFDIAEDHFHEKPVTQNFASCLYPASCRRTLANLFHTRLSFITAPLRDAGVTGIPIASGDGVLHRGHLIVACYIGDYPEQLLVTCVKTGWCPNGEVEQKNLGDGDSTCPLRNLAKILDAMDKLDEGGTVYAQTCKDAGIKPVVHPFWQDLPYTNIFLSITSDVLHQLYQGIIKHLIEWLKEACGEAELDARCRLLPPNHNIRLFMKGISNLNRVTGREHDQISRFLLGIIIDVKLPRGLSPVRLVQAVRGILHFVFSAQYPMHTTETLELLEDARMWFHQNKGIFVDLGIRDDFNLPKLHLCEHYVPNIKLFGTSDNYNTENTERLHIDLAKDAYWRLAGLPTNIARYRKHWQGNALPFRKSPRERRKLTMPKHPTQKAPALTAAQIEREAISFDVPFTVVPVFQRIKFSTSDPYANDGPTDSIVDSIHVQPRTTLNNGDHIPARFDTALINTGAGGKVGIERYRIAQVKVVFTLPPRLAKTILPPTIVPPKYLAWRRQLKTGDHLASIIPVNNIRRNIHLLPKFGPVAPPDWKSHNVLDKVPGILCQSMD